MLQIIMRNYQLVSVVSHCDYEGSTMLTIAERDSVQQNDR